MGLGIASLPESSVAAADGAAVCPAEPGVTPGDSAHRRHLFSPALDGSYTRPAARPGSGAGRARVPGADQAFAAARMGGAELRRQPVPCGPDAVATLEAPFSRTRNSARLR